MSGVVTAERRRELLEETLAGLASQSGRVESQGQFQAVVVFGKPANHVLHVLLSVFTCGLWLPVWAVVAWTSVVRRRMVYVDELGSVVFNDGKGWIAS